jgi:hypothetical protein
MKFSLFYLFLQSCETKNTELVAPLMVKDKTRVVYLEKLNKKIALLS